MQSGNLAKEYVDDYEITPSIVLSGMNLCKKGGKKIHGLKMKEGDQFYSLMLLGGSP